MLELLSEPAALALVGTIGGGIALRATESMMGRKRTTSTPHDVFSCNEWETRHREANPFMDQGDPVPLKDMTVCWDDKCENCLPTRKAINPNFGKPVPPKGPGGSSMARPAPGGARPISRASSICPRCGGYVRDGNVHLACAGGVNMTWTKSHKRTEIVPVIPKAKALAFGEVKPVTEIKTRKQNVEQFEVHAGDLNSPVHRWKEITDPDTGEHLGTLVWNGKAWVSEKTYRQQKNGFKKLHQSKTFDESPPARYYEEIKKMREFPEMKLKRRWG